MTTHIAFSFFPKSFFRSLLSATTKPFQQCGSNSPPRQVVPLLDGKEFAAHKEIAETLGIDVSFAHPYHSWERGANEDVNGPPIRQYIPQKIIIRRPQTTKIFD